MPTRLPHSGSQESQFVAGAIVGLQGVRRIQDSSDLKGMPLLSAPGVMNDWLGDLSACVPELFR